MFGNYIKVALRALKKNKLYALINIMGLSVGLAVYVFTTLLANYETTHDTMWENADNIYTVGATFNPKLQVGISETDGAQHALAPLMKNEVPEMEYIARTINRQFLVSIDANNFYENVRFADPELLDIFDLTFLQGNASALDDPSSVILSRSMADKLFGEGVDPMGKSISLDHKDELTVSAVLEDLPPNTHFSALLIMSNPLDIIIPMGAMERITEFKPDENWGNLSVGNMTYVQLPPHLDGDWLLAQLRSIEERLVPAERFEVIEHFTVYPIIEANQFLWRGLGLPAILIVQFLGLLVLAVACINYTNLATAQSMKRAREVGMRKTLGAGRKQLLMQFLVESTTIATIAMALAVAIIEVALPLFNEASGKLVVIDYIAIMPWLILSTLAVGLIAGAYPAFLITKTQPIDALRESATKGAKGGFFRSLMIGAQFLVSVLLIAMVSVMYMQNKKAEESSYVFPKDNIYTLSRIGEESIEKRHQTLKTQMLEIQGVETVSYSSQVPFEQNNNSMTTSTLPASKDRGFFMNILRADHDFFKAYDIPLVAGRWLSDDIAMDTYVKEVNEVNVIVNELAVSKLGFANNQAALGQEFVDVDETEDQTIYRIVGIVPSQNILGLHNSIKPWVFFTWPEAYRSLSLRIDGQDITATTQAIEKVWRDVIPEFPLEGRFLDENFQMIYSMFKGINAVLALFAGIALLLALFGLFGLAAFMAAQRTKEIGLRKVLGASSYQIAKMLVFKFSKPVVIAAIPALLLSYFLASFYLDLFADRIDPPYVIILLSGVIAIIVSWATVASHAIRVARQNPIKALRYE